MALQSDVLEYLYHQQIHGSAAAADGLFHLPDRDCGELGASFAEMCINDGLTGNKEEAVMSYEELWLAVDCHCDGLQLQRLRVVVRLGGRFVGVMLCVPCVSVC